MKLGDLFQSYQFPLPCVKWYKFSLSFHSNFVTTTIWSVSDDFQMQYQAKLKIFQLIKPFPKYQ